MIEPPLSPDEPFRLASLRRTNMLDTPLEERFERITRLARRLLGAPIAAISLVDAGRQWFKSIQGLDVDQTTREMSFCGHTILGDDLMVIPNAHEDPRFTNNPLVTADPRIVFYAGYPLRGPDGLRVGAFCVIDREPRELSEDDRQILRDLGALVEKELSSTVVVSARNDFAATVSPQDRAALLDPVTRLWNADGIGRVLEHELNEMKRDESARGVVLVELDGLRDLGDETAATAISILAKRLLGAVRSNDSLGHLGDGRFLVVLGALGFPDEATAIAARVRSRATESVPTPAGAIDVTTHAAAVYVPAERMVGAAVLLERAEQALSRLKQVGDAGAGPDVLGGAAA